MILGTIKKVVKLTVNYADRFFDKRLEVRGEQIMKNMVARETVVLNQLSDSRGEYVGAIRFFSNNLVTEEALIEESSERCKNATKGTHVLAIQDTSEINYQTHRGKLSCRDKELGPVGNGKDIGFFIHPVFVLERENEFPLGIADTRVWNRDWEKPNKNERKYQSQPIEEKESYRWIESAERAKEVLEGAASVTIVADREGDIYEEFVKVPDTKTDLIIRSLHNRRISDCDKKLFEHLSELEVVGTYDLEVKKGQKKRIPRIATITVRYNRVKIARPQNCSQDYPEYIEVYAIEARESTETIPAFEMA